MQLQLARLQHCCSLLHWVLRQPDQRQRYAYPSQWSSMILCSRAQTFYAGCHRSPSTCAATDVE